ncbi:uncharacterized protein M8220_014027 [Acridotheres tristis]
MAVAEFTEIAGEAEAWGPQDGAGEPPGQRAGPALRGGTGCISPERASGPAVGKGPGREKGRQKGPGSLRSGRPIANFRLLQPLSGPCLLQPLSLHLQGRVRLCWAPQHGPQGQGRAGAVPDGNLQESRTGTLYKDRQREHKGERIQTERDPAHAALCKAPVGERGPCPPLSALAAAPFEEPLQELLTLLVVVLEYHHPLAPPGAGPAPGPAQNETPPAVPPGAAPQPPGSRPVAGGFPGASPAARQLGHRPRAAGAAAPGASGCPGQNAESAVPSPQAEKPPLEQLYREGPLLGRGGCGSVYAGTRLADGAPVAIKRVGRDRIWEWARLHNGALVPLELVLLWMVSCPGFRGVVRLLDWFELPDSFALVMERPERCRDLWHLLDAGRFLPEPVARGLFCQVLQAVRHCTSRGVLHRDIKAENILVDLATGEVKLIDFGCGTFLQDTFYTHMAGTPQYNPPEWILFGCYHGQPATIWSLGILLYDLVCGRLPFKTPEDIVRGQFFLPPRVSQECQHLIRWCLSMDPADRPCLEDLFEHSWLQNPQLAQETAEIHPSAQ